MKELLCKIETYLTNPKKSKPWFVARVFLILSGLGLVLFFPWFFIIYKIAGVENILFSAMTSSIIASVFIAGLNAISLILRKDI